MKGGPMSEAHRELRERIWNLSNLITGFAVLQAVATIFFVIQHPGLVSCWAEKIATSDKLLVNLSPIPLLVLIFGGGFLAYSLVLLLCRIIVRQAEFNETALLLNRTLMMRIIIIFSFNIMAGYVAHLAITPFMSKCS